MPLNRKRKGYSLTLWDLKQEGRVLPCSASAWNEHVGRLEFSAVLGISKSDHKGTMDIDSEVINNC